MRRRLLVGGALAASAIPAAISGALAQSGGKPRKLAIVSPAEPVALMVENGENPYYRALFEELRRLGQIEGKTLVVERYGRDSGAGSSVELMQQAVHGQPDVVYGIAFGALLKQAAAAVPVVALTANPVALGLAESLARPGGNITGVSVDIGPEIHGKRVELLREAFPALSGLGFLTLRQVWETAQGPAMRATAERAGLRLIPKLVDLPASEKSFRDAIGELRRDGADAAIVGDNPAALGFRAAIVEAMAEARLPAMYTFPETVEAGGLMAYSFDLKELNRYAARSIDAILRGTPPGTIPFYQATTFVLSINLRTAAAQGIVFPQSVLGRADRVIE